MRKAVVLHSGGLDSTLCLDTALKSGAAVTSLCIFYGQKNIREQLAAIDIVQHYHNQGYKIERRTVDISDIWEGTRSALIDDGDKLDEWTPEQVANFRGEANSSVEFRNGVFIAVGTVQAMLLGAEELWIGMTGQGADQYADCSQDFCYHMFKAAYAGSGNRVMVRAPLNSSNKEMIVRGALGARIPIGLTWTCYEAGNVHCGTCLACVERRAAFEKIGQEDPIEYKADRG